MSDAAFDSVSVNPPANGAGSGDDFSVPVPRPKTSIFKLVGEVPDHGVPGYLQFAITHIFNADRGFWWFDAR